MTQPHKPKLIITIDGPAAAGKSSAAQLLAQRLGYTYIDTGVMYRALAWAALKRGVIPEQKDIATRLFEELGVSFHSQGQRFRVLAQGEDITRRLRDSEISHYASSYSALPAVRGCLVKLQREMGCKGGVVVEGRDIGTVVFPEADYKFFLSASPMERGRRRFNELKDNGARVKLDHTTEQIKNRDRQDSERQLAPLRQAPDAIVIDTTRLTLEQVVNKILTSVVGNNGQR